MDGDIAIEAKQGEEMKSSDLTITYSLDIECPYCGADIDLCDQDDEGFLSRPVFNNRWEDLEGKAVTCPDCDKTFKISSVRT